MPLEINEELAFDADRGSSGLAFDDEAAPDPEGFNDHGVRENFDDEGDLTSVDIIYEAMEPGPPKRRNGVRITEDFLRKVADKEYRKEPPHLVDHKSKETFSNIGTIPNIWFDEGAGKLALMARVPNTGSRTHDEAISRYTHEPPAIRDGSVGFGQQYKAARNNDGEPELRDGKLREFSAVNFPGGYDEGGVSSAFAEAVEEAMAEFDDAPQEEAGDGDGAENSAAGQTEHSNFESVRHETIRF